MWCMTERTSRPRTFHLKPQNLNLKANTRCAGALGSPGFVSPEVVHDGPHEPAMDVFSLGVVAFVMLVGRKPFSIQVPSPFPPTIPFPFFPGSGHRVIVSCRTATAVPVCSTRQCGCGCAPSHMVHSVPRVSTSSQNRLVPQCRMLLGGPWHRHASPLCLLGDVLGTLSRISYAARFVQDSENLRYCEMDIKDAPGLKDPRCVVASEECSRGALAECTSSATFARENSLATIATGNKSGLQGCISWRRWQNLSPAAKDLLMGMMAYNTKHRLTAQQVRRGLKSCEPTTWSMILSCQGPVYGVSSHNPEHCVMDRHLRLKRAPAASFTPLLPFGYLLPAVCRRVSCPGPFKHCCLQPRQALASAPLSGCTTCFPSRQCGLRL